MSAATTNFDGSIDNKNDFIAAVKGPGVVLHGGSDEEDVLLTTEGEGRGTRYFVDGEKVAKAEVEQVWEDFDADDLEVWGGDDEVESRTYDEAVDFAAELLTDGEPNEKDGKIISLVTGEYKGYITGSHVKASPAPINSVSEYRRLVVDAAAQNGVDFDEGDVVIAPSDLRQTFEDAGNSLDQETRDRISEQVSARWEDGEYDHLRKESDDSDE